jgi:DNA-binding transcriptional LysR family regulator
MRKKPPLPSPRERALNFHQVEAFRAVMLCGSMTGAAEMINTSQPAVSRLVAQLERATGLLLFERAGSRVQPTAEALAFYREVDRLFGALGSLAQSARTIRTFGTGHIRIASLPSLGLGFVPRAIRRFREKYPDVTVSLQTRSSATVIEWTAAHQCDLGLAAKGPDVRGVAAQLFVSAAGACILPPGHRLAEKQVIRPADLEGESFVSLGLSDLTRAKVDRVFAAAGVNRRLSVETQYAAAVCACVLEGLGVSIVNPFVPPDFYSRGLLMRRFEPEVTIDKLILFPRGKPTSALVGAFVETLETCRDEELRRHGALMRPPAPPARRRA